MKNHKNIKFTDSQFYFLAAVSNGEVWLLDRNVFQKIMMSTGKQRMADQIKFLKAVPLLKSLPDEILNRYELIFDKSKNNYN